jgi:hypothetical protein
MDEKYTSNNNKNHDTSLNIDEQDYKNLITILKKISENISLLEKKITR